MPIYGAVCHVLIVSDPNHSGCWTDNVPVPPDDCSTMLCSTCSQDPQSRQIPNSILVGQGRANRYLILYWWDKVICHIKKRLVSQSSCQLGNIENALILLVN